ncbi:MAG: 3-keto-disaccharide hydrolase [Akkermansiaceae bacterium]
MKSITQYSILAIALSAFSCQAEANPTIIPAQATESEKSTAVSLFDGKTLAGWKAVNPKNAKFWSVKDGIIEASNGDKKMPINTYLATTSEYENFEFTCEFRLSGDHATGLINSGIQYRSVLKKHKKKGVTIVGYQADIGKDWWGGIYDEHRRGKLVMGDSKELLASEGFKDDSWHTYKIVCKGDHHQLYIDGILTAGYTEEEAKIPTKGVIALQLHKGGIAKMQYRNIQIKPL